MRAALVEPEWRVVEKRDTFEEAGLDVPELRECVLVAVDSSPDGYAELYYDPVEDDFVLASEALVASWSPSDEVRRRLSVTIAIALDFWTWQRMADMGLNDSAAAELMTDIAACAVKTRRRRAGQSERPRPDSGESARGARRQTRG